MAGAAPAAPTPAPTAAPAAATPASPVTADAQTAINNANRATLQQLAATGTAGQAATDQTVGAVQTDRQAALKSILTSAAFSGSGASVAGPATGGAPNDQQALAGIVNAPFTTATGIDQSLGAAFNSANALRSQGAGTYFKEASAALPVVEANTNEKIAGLRATAQQKALTDALSLARAQLSLNKALATTTKAPAIPGGGTTVGQSILDGRTAAEKAATDAYNKGLSAHLGDTSGATVTTPNGTFSDRTGGNLGAATQQLPPSPPDMAQVDAQYYAQIDQQNGWPAGTAQALAENADTKNTASGQLSQERTNTLSKPPPAPTAADVRNDPNYSKATAYATQAWAVKGSTLASVVGALTQYAGLSDLQAYVVATDTQKDRPKNPTGAPAPLPGSQAAAGLGY